MIGSEESLTASKPCRLPPSQVLTVEELERQLRGEDIKQQPTDSNCHGQTAAVGIPTASPLQPVAGPHSEHLAVRVGNSIS